MPAGTYEGLIENVLQLVILDHQQCLLYARKVREMTDPQLNVDTGPFSPQTM